MQFKLLFNPNVLSDIIFKVLYNFFVQLGTWWLRKTGVNTVDWLDDAVFLLLKLSLLIFAYELNFNCSPYVLDKLKGI